MPVALVGMFGLAVACSKSTETAPSPAADPVAPGSDVVKKEKKPHKAGDKHQPLAADAVALTLDVAVGSDVMTWKKDEFAKVDEYAIGSDGNERQVWSMRDLATKLVGPTAHVVAITGVDGSTKPMAAADWADTTKTPILHTTRRGTLKFTWADSQGTWGETVVKDVTRIEIAR